MNTPTQTEGLRIQAPPRTDFSKLTKAQLVARLKFAEGIMISLRDIYRAEGARPEPYPGAFGSDRGFAQGMEQAHLLIIQDPDDWLAGSMND